MSPLVGDLGEAFYVYILFAQVVDKHLSILAKRHMETRFVKIQAEKSPFLADKLKIVVLPTLAIIKNAKVDDYVVRFIDWFVLFELTGFFFFLLKWST